MKITTGRKISITVSKAFVEELITPVFPEYPEYREEETRPRVRVSCIVYTFAPTLPYCLSIFKELHGRNHGIGLGLTETQSTYNDRAVLLPLRLPDSPNGDENTKRYSHRVTPPVLSNGIKFRRANFVWESFLPLPFTPYPGRILGSILLGMGLWPL